MYIKFKIATNIQVNSYKDNKELEIIKNTLDKINIDNGNIFDIVLGDNKKDFEEFKIYGKGIILNYEYITDKDGFNGRYVIDLRVQTSFRKDTEINTLKEIFNFITSISEVGEKCLIEFIYNPFLHRISDEKYGVYIQEIYIEHEFNSNYKTEIKELFNYVENNFTKNKSEIVFAK